MEAGTVHIIEGVSYIREHCPVFGCKKCDLYDKNAGMGRTCQHPQGITSCTDLDAARQKGSTVTEIAFHFKKVIV